MVQCGLTMFKSIVGSKISSKRGQGMVEYGLILVFVVGIAAVALTTDSGIGAALKSAFDDASTALNK